MDASRVVHGAFVAIAGVRSRQADVAVGEVDAQNIDSVPPAVSIVHLPQVCDIDNT